jgi:copper homeostasis protein
MNGAQLEIAANSIESADAAEAGGAARIELCAALELGGVTPSHAMVAIARERAGIPIHVLIRPRPGTFVYDGPELETMLRDIEHCKALGCDGVVVGALDADGRVDLSRCRALMDAARGMPVTFHRAFDCTCDPPQALEAVIALGCNRLLTSGQQRDAPAGAALIRALIEQARGRIEIMPGAGITAGNITALAAATGARAFHASAKVRVPNPMRRRDATIDGLPGDSWRTDIDQVRAMVAALRAIPASG